MGDNIIPVYLTCTHHMAKYGQLNGKHTELFEIFQNLLWNLIYYKTQKPFFLKEGNGKLMLYNSHLCWHALPMSCANDKCHFRGSKIAHVLFCLKNLICFELF